MSLETWLGNRWLTRHETSPREVADLLAVVDRDLADARIEGLSTDRRLGIAYNAALQLALLALAASGYRPERHRAHERAIRSLEHTIGLDRAVVDTLDAVRRKRHLANYERAGTTSESEADEVYVLASELRAQVLEWLAREHPEMIAD